MDNFLPQCQSFSEDIPLKPNSALVKFIGGASSILSTKSDECVGCSYWQECTLGKESQLLLNSVYPNSFRIEGENNTIESHYFFKNQGIYKVIVGEHDTEISIERQPKFADIDHYLIPLALALPFLLDLFILCFSRFWKRHGEQNEEPSSSNEKRRYGSIDAARGLAIAWMIFVNYGGGSLPLMEHAAWHGFTFADFVFPFFLFIVGASYALTITKPLNAKFNRRMVFRAAKLFFIGILLNNGRSWSYLRIPGVLQRIAIAHILFHFIRVVLNRIDFGYHRLSDEEQTIHGSPGLRKEFIVVALISTAAQLMEYLPSPECPWFYLAPGGVANDGSYFVCTGGFTHYLDHVVLGDSHLYNKPTCKELYHTAVHFDPEGILGTILSIGNVFAGFYTVYILRNPWKIARNHITLVALVVITLATALHFTILPINKNLWTMSYVLLSSGLAQLLFLCLYYLIDNYGTSLPTLQAMGRYPLTLYIFHGIARGRFPVNWSVAPDTLSQFIMCSYGLLFHIALTWVMHCGKFQVIFNIFE